MQQTSLVFSLPLSGGQTEAGENEDLGYQSGAPGSYAQAMPKAF